MPTIHFETLGCKLNQIETESLAEAFSGQGFTVHLGRENSSSADIITDTDTDTGDIPLLTQGPLLCILNTCTVTGKAEQKARRLIRLLLKNHPLAPVLVTGCYAEVEREAITSIDTRVFVLGGSRKRELAGLPELLAGQLTAEPDMSIHPFLSAFCEGKPAEKAENPAFSGTFALATDNFRSHSRASIKIQDGCDNHCSYCRIRLARGKSVSLPGDEVISRIQKIEKALWAEVILSGVNLSQYRSSSGDFAQLLDRILSETDTIAIRISSLYPERIDETILPFLAHERIRPHFHLSVQSGSDSILAAMRRPYTAGTVYLAAERLRSVKENPFLACDIITGFPGETDSDFEQTLKLCRDINFAWIHAFPFSPRPGTEAFSMKNRIPERVAGERIAVLTALAEKNRQAYEAYWKGRTLRAIPEKPLSPGEITVLTANYLSLRVEGATTQTDESFPRGREISVECTGNGKARFVK